MTRIYLSLTLVLTLLLGGCGFEPNSSNVKISEQPAKGLTESSFDHHYLQQLVDETRQTAEERLVKTYERNNIPPHERFSHAEVSGRYESLGNRLLAVVDLSYSANPMRVMRVVGLAGDKLVTVSCLSPHGEPLVFEAKEGECAEAIATHFGQP
jgi:hypothetical protein